MIEYIALNPVQKRKYMKRYYEVAKKFYGETPSGVSESEIDACVRRFKEKPLPEFRKRIVLNKWKFKLDANDRGVKIGYFSPGYDDSKWEQVTIPHSCKYIPPKPTYFGRLDCNAVKTPTIYQASYDAWYRTEFPLEEIGTDQTACLRFESVQQTSTVWLNDNPVMLDHLGLYPYSMDLGDELRKQKGNHISLAVRARTIVTNRPNLFYSTWSYAYRNPPFTHGKKEVEDWQDQAAAGIAGPVILDIFNGVHLGDVFVHTKEIGENTASIACQIDLYNTTWEGFTGRIRVEISPWLPKEGKAVKAVAEAVGIIPMNQTQINLTFEMRNPALWDVDNPNLYLVHVILENELGKPIDDVYESFGVRTIQIKGSSLYLNNRRIVPRGTHNSTVYQNESEVFLSDQIIVKEILLHKKMSAICSRWPSDKNIHYRKIAEYCDQLGYMLSWCGYLQIWGVHPEMEMYAQRDLKMMVRNLRNHPSIIIWELGDEPIWFEHDFRRQKWYEKAYDFVSAEDQSRPIIPSGHWAEDLANRIEELHKKGMNYPQARTAVVKELPIYNRELAVWDYHHCPSGRPVMPVIDWIKNALAGKRPTVFTEFGVHGLPEFSKVKDVYGKFRWIATPFFIIQEGQDAYAKFFYGKKIGADDWRETQAAQAIIDSAMITRIRQYPEEFCAYYHLTMFDVWVFYWGMVDVHGNPKLAYNVVKSCFQPVFISGLNGNTVLKEGEEIAVTVSNYADALVNASLQVQIKNDNDQIVDEYKFIRLSIPGDVALSSVGRFLLKKFKPGLYSIEYRLNNITGDEIAKTVELFFILRIN